MSGAGALKAGSAGGGKRPTIEEFQAHTAQHIAELKAELARGDGTTPYVSSYTTMDGANDLLSIASMLPIPIFRAARGVGSAAQLAKQLGSKEGVAELLSGGGKAIAGVGTKVAIRDVGRLVSEYGGRAENWVKITSTAPGHLQTHAYRNIVTGAVVELKSIAP